MKHRTKIFLHAAEYFAECDFHEDYLCCCEAISEGCFGQLRPMLGRTQVKDFFAHWFMPKEVSFSGFWWAHHMPDWSLPGPDQEARLLALYFAAAISETEP